jgi:Flp pilus assembly protein TadD
LQPNNADARTYCAWVYRRRGEWERSLADSKRAEELDPREARIPTNIGVTYIVLLASTRRAMSTRPGDLSIVFQR